MDWGTLSAILVLVGEVLIPLVLAVVLPRRVALQAIAALGLVVLGLLAYLGYRDSLVENGGDWRPGAEAASMALLVNLAFLLPLWLVGTVAGLTARSRVSARRTARQRA